MTLCLIAMFFNQLKGHKNKQVTIVDNNHTVSTQFYKCLISFVFHEDRLMGQKK